jgi:hypothetical protein
MGSSREKNVTERTCPRNLHAAGPFVIYEGESVVGKNACDARVLGQMHIVMKSGALISGDGGSRRAYSFFCAGKPRSVSLPGLRRQLSHRYRKRFCHSLVFATAIAFATSEATKF